MSVPFRSVLPGLSLLLLGACGQNPPSAIRDPATNEAGYPWSYTAPAGQLTTLSLTPGVNTLYYEPMLSAKNGWGPVEVDRSNGEQGAHDGHALTINGKTYAKGFGVHASSELRYSLKGTDGAVCTRFAVGMGVDDEVGDRGSVTFQIFLDGIKAYDSGTMTGVDALKTASVDITGRSELWLVVTDAGNGITNDHADWVSPTITCMAPAAAPVIVTFDRTELSVFHKHSASLNATFTTAGHLNGPLNLRLEPVILGRGLPLQLRTTSVPFTGPGTATRSLTFAAPFTLLSNDPDDLSAPYRLIASVNGQDVGSASLRISVRPMQVSARLIPSRLSGHDGQTMSATVEVTVTPPLEQLSSINVLFAPNLTQTADRPIAEIVSVGVTQQQQQVLRATAQIRFIDDPQAPVPDDDTVSDETLFVLVNDGTGEELFGYRRPVYGNLTTPLTLHLLR